jgi:hypothetical protein
MKLIFNVSKSFFTNILSKLNYLGQFCRELDIKHENKIHRLN